MLKIKITLALIFFSFVSTFAQKSLNEYKYVIVPVKYDFQKVENKYKINSLVKYLFEKEGFNMLMGDSNYPVDLSQNHCLALTANLVNSSNMLSTKTHFELLDCNNNKVFSTSIAKSKEKDFQKAYHESIRKTFEDVKAQNYKYEPKEVTPAVVPVAVVTTTTDVPKSTEVVTKTENKEVVKTKAAVVAIPVVTVKKVDTSVLYAQEIANGYQLVDSTPKVVYIALKTSMKDVYMIKGSNGTISKKNGVWVAEYYEGDTLVQKELNIKLMD